MIKIDATEVQALSRRLEQVSKDFKTDRQRALSSTRRASGTQVKREVVKVYSLPQRRVDQGLTITGVDPTDLSFRIIGSKKVIGLQNFANRGNKKAGVRVQVLRGHGFKAPGRGPGNVRSKAFYAKGLIFQREDIDRLPVTRLSGPSVADMLNKTIVLNNIAKFATDRIGIELQRKLTAALRG